MMFHRISHRIALQFTFFVFLLLLLNGAFFLAADFGNEHRMMRFRLERMAEMIGERFEPGMMRMPVMPRGGGFPPHMIEQVRVLDAKGNPLFAGSFFSDIPVMQPMKPLTPIVMDDEKYIVFTDPFERNGQVAGYVQIADTERYPRSDLPMRISLYLFISIIVSALTYIVGLYFARKSLQPAQEMMARLEQFTQDASHEIRTPLAALNFSLDLALKTKKYQEGIYEAKEDVRQIVVLMERLLELTRLDAHAWITAPVDLSNLTKESVDRMKPLAQAKGVTLQHHIESNIIKNGDSALLRQILTNLIGNALKFGREEGGIVIVRLSSRSLTVEDDGIGIDARDLPHIFHRFFQADGSRGQEGLGLGLSLVERIVHLHGWNIEAKSKKGRGSIFIITF